MHRTTRTLLPALCLLTCASCQLDTAPAGPVALQRQGTSDDGVSATDGVIGEAPMRIPSSDSGAATGANAVGEEAGDGGLTGSAGAAGNHADAGQAGSGTSGNAGNAGKSEPTSGGAGGRGVVGMSGSGGVGANAGGAGSGGMSAGGAGRSEAGAGQAGSAASGGNGGRDEPAAGRGTGGARGQAGSPSTGGGDTVATFNELIDQLSGALTDQQRNRIVQALTTDSVTPDQLNQLLDAVKGAGACEGGHDACQQMCMLVLGACPSCTNNSMTADAELAMCTAL